MSPTIHVNAPGVSAAIRGLLRRAIGHTLRADGVREGEVSVTLLGDTAIQALNREYLGHDRVTDVLSFALHGADEPVLGDVYVGAEQAGRQAAEAGVPLDEELARLAIHGTLHLLGHDHPEGPGRYISPMFRLQEERLATVLARAAAARARRRERAGFPDGSASGPDGGGA